MRYSNMIIDFVIALVLGLVLKETAGFILGAFATLRVINLERRVQP